MSRVIQCELRFFGEEIALLPLDVLVSPSAALALLLNSPEATIGEDTLVPCFDADEMHRRNLMRRR